MNINHVVNKFEPLSHIFKDKVHVLLLSETKLDETFPLGQFNVYGYKTPFRRDRNIHGGGLLLYVKNDIPCKEIKLSSLPSDIECLFVELNLRKTKYILIGGYNPHRESISYFLGHIGKELDKLMVNYDNILLLGDMNATQDNISMKNFNEIYNLENLIKEPTCFKNPQNPSSIDVMLTNDKTKYSKSMTLETGLSDHHKMTISVLKASFVKKAPITITYRNYDNLNENHFKSDLFCLLHTKANQTDLTYDEFKKIFMEVLNSHFPTKTKLVRGNQQPFMNRTLSKEFMHRSKLKNIYNKFPTEQNLNNFKKQRNFCTNLLRKEKKRYYNNLNLSLLCDSKKFWKNVKPLLSDKQCKSDRNIVLIENDTIITEDETVAEKLNNFFLKSVETLDIKHYTAPLENRNENLDYIIEYYKNHPSVLKIKEHITTLEKFNFSDVAICDIFEEISKLDPSKASVTDDLPTKTLIRTKDIISEPLAKVFNKSKNNCIFPKTLKLAEVTPIHKKDETTLMKNYRPVSLLPIVSKLFEKKMSGQIVEYIDGFLSPYLFGYRKSHSAEQCLAVMLEQWRGALDNKDAAGAVLTDLSKAFDCLNHNLLLAKLNAYGFGREALEFVSSYLKYRKQRSKINKSFSLYDELKYGVPQGSILGPLLFNIFINDLFFFINESKLANYADDNTLYAVENNVSNLLKLLEMETNKVLKWFEMNEMKPNADKCHLIVCNKNKCSVTLDNNIIEGEKFVELLGMTITNDLKFSDHITILCKRANQKLHALARISKFVKKDKLRILMKAFVMSQFNYCPLIWMFCNRTSNNKINRLHERALRLVYEDENLTFEELLEKDNSVTIHQRNLQKLSVEMYKVKNDLAPQPFRNLFTEKFCQYDLRNKKTWESHNIRTVIYGSETLTNMGPKIWELVPNTIKDSDSLCEFRRRIKSWKPEGCPCRLCKTFINELGFL